MAWMSAMGRRVDVAVATARACTANDCFCALRPTQIDPIRSAGLFQSGRTADHRFSCFASTKRLFVISHTRPQPVGGPARPVVAAASS